jgi:hypothetical protein
MGDLLITTNLPGNLTEIPTFLDSVDAAMPSNQQSFPLGLRQKLYLINDQIALALAGNVYQMTTFLEDIKNFFKFHTTTYQNLNSFMEGYDQESVLDCSILVIIVESFEEALVPNILAFGNWERYTDPLIENGLITGTGKRAFFDKLQLISRDNSAHSDLRNTNLILLSLFLADERYTLDSIIDSWGAGFEVIEFYEGKFRKMDNLTYVICHTEINEEGTSLTNIPFLVMHYTYHGEILTINTYLDNEFKRYGVLPLDIKKENFDSSQIPDYNGFESTQVLCTFVVKKKNGNFFHTSVLTNPDDGFDAIKVKFQPPAPAYLEIHIDEMLSDKILEGYRQSPN